MLLCRAVQLLQIGRSPEAHQCWLKRCSHRRSCIDVRAVGDATRIGRGAGWRGELSDAVGAVIRQINGCLDARAETSRCWRLQAPSRQGASSGDSRRLYSGAPRAVGREMATTFFSGGARSTEGAKVTISRKVLGAAFARPPAAALRATTLAPAAPFSLLLWALGACGAVF